MASRYLKAAIPQAQSVYTPMPLEFINQTLSTDQGKYDTAVGQIAALNALNQQVAPWNQGEEVALIGKYTPQIEELANQLYKTGEVGQVVPQISKLNQQWLNDEERKRLQAGYDFYKTTEEPRMKGENYHTAYNALKKYDAQGNEIGWADDINNFNLANSAYIEGDQDKYLTGQLDRLVGSKLETIYGKGTTFQDPNTGKWMYREPGTKTVEELNLSNDFTKDAIENLAYQISTGTDTPHQYYQKKRGASDYNKALEIVSDLASTRYYTNKNIQPGNEGFIPGMGDDGSGSTKQGDFVYTIQPIGLGEVGPETYLNISQNLDAYNTQQGLLEQGILKQSGDIINSFDDGNGNNPLKQMIEQQTTVEGLDPVDAVRQGLKTAQQYYNTLPEGSPQKLKLQGQIVKMGDSIKQYDRLNLNKEFLAKYKTHIDTEISGKYLSNKDRLSKVDKFIDGALSDSFIGSLDNVDVKRTKKSSDVTLEEKGELVNLIKQYEANGRYGNKNNEVIEDRILDLLGMESSGDKSFVLGSIFSQLEGVSGYDKLSASINQYTKDPSVYTGIKFNPNRLTIAQDAGLDTNIEEWNKGLQASYQDGTISSIAGSLNMSPKDFIKSAISFDGAKLPTEDQLKDYKFDNVEMVDIGSVPKAMYTFSKEGKQKFSVVANLTATNNKVIIQDAAIDLWNKGLGKDQTAMNMAARMMATSAIDEDTYSQLLYMFKLNQPDNVNPFTLNIKGLPIQVSKVGQDQYSIRAVNSQGQTSNIVVNGEEDVLTAIGTTALNSLSSGGNSNQGKSVPLDNW